LQFDYRIRDQSHREVESIKRFCPKHEGDITKREHAETPRDRD